MAPLRLRGYPGHVQTSAEISQMASQQLGLFQQSQAYTSSIGQAAGMPPPPSANLAPAFYNTSGQIGAQVASAGVGAANIGMMGASIAAGFGAFGSAGRVLDPFSGVLGAAQLGFGAGGGQAAMMSGSIAPIARGIGFGAAAAGGYLAAGSLFNAMTDQLMRGAHEQLAMNSMLSQNFTRRSAPMMSVSPGTMNQLSGSLIGMTSTHQPFADVANTVGAGLSAGLYRGASSLGQFQEQTQHLMQGTQALMNTYGGSRADAVGMIAQTQQLGYYNPQQATNVALSYGMSANAHGLSPDTFMRAGQAGAQVARNYGAPIRMGASMSSGLANRLAAGTSSGRLSESAIRDMAGGAPLDSALSEVSGNLTNAAFQAAYSDSTALMGLMDPETGHIDPGLAAGFQSGMIGRTELKRMAQKNKGDRSARMAFQARRGGLAQELLSEVGTPEAMLAGMAKSDIASRGIRQGESSGDVMSMALEKFGGLGEQQAALVRELISAGPSMQSDIQARLQKEVASAMGAGPQMGVLERLKKKLVDKFVEPIAAPMREMGASIQRWGADAAESAMESIFGTSRDRSMQLTPGGAELSRGLMSPGSSSGRAAMAVLGATRGYGEGPSGVSIGGSNYVYGHDSSNFGSPGFIDHPMAVTSSMMGASVGAGIGGWMMGGAGSGMMQKGWSSITSMTLGRMASSPLSSLGTLGGGIARVAGGGAARVLGTGLGVLGSLPALGISSFVLGGDAGDYLGSADNRGAVPRGLAEAYEAFGGGEVSSRPQAGYVPVEENDAGWWAGVGNWQDRLSRGWNQGLTDDLDVRHKKYIDAEASARDPAYAYGAMVAPDSMLREVFDEGGLNKLKSIYKSKRQGVMEARSGSKNVASIVDAFGTEGAAMIRGDGRTSGQQAAVLEALTKGEVGFSAEMSKMMGGLVGSMTDPAALKKAARQLFNQANGMTAPSGKSVPTFKTDGSFVGDVTGAIGMSIGGMSSIIRSSIETAAPGLMGGISEESFSSLQSAIEGKSGKKVLSGMHDFMLGGSYEGLTNTFLAMPGADRNDQLRELMTGKLKGKHDKIEELRTGMKFMAKIGLDAQNQLDKDLVESYREQINPYAPGSRNDGANRVAERIGSRNSRDLWEYNNRALEQLASDDKKGYSNTMESLTRSALNIDSKSRHYALEQLSPDAQDRVASASTLYDSINRKGRRRGRGVVTALSMLEGSELVLDDKLGDEIAKQVNRGKGMSDGLMIDIESILRKGGVSGDALSSAKNNIRQMAKGGGDDAAKGFATAVGNAQGAKFKGGGQVSQGGELKAAVDMFKTAVADAAKVIGAAAKGGGGDGKPA